MRNWRRRLQFAALFPALTLIGACASPEARFDRVAASANLQKVVLQGDGFEHAVFRQDAPIDTSKPLHIYLGGDGSPWIDNQPADDPTPRNPLTLRLMSLDQNQSIYVGRPCYHGLHDAPACQNALWTSARYSSAVIDSMTSAINNIIESEQLENVVLIGYSGGGTIAVLAAQDIKAVTRVVTIAANLDTDAWSRHHNYEPLRESLNPAQQPPLAKTIRQLHLVAENDETVPPSTSQRYFDLNVSSSRISYKAFDHRCCWLKIWRDFVAGLTE